MSNILFQDYFILIIIYSFTSTILFKIIISQLINASINYANRNYRCVTIRSTFQFNFPFVLFYVLPLFPITTRLLNPNNKLLFLICPPFNRDLHSWFAQILFTLLEFIIFESFAARCRILPTLYDILRHLCVTPGECSALLLLRLSFTEVEVNSRRLPSRQ